MTRRIPRLDLTPFPAELYLVTTEAQFDRVVADLDADPEHLVPWQSAGQTQQFLVGERGKVAPRWRCVVAIDVATLGSDQVRLANTAIHEATHAALMLFDWTGQEYDGADEPLAYVLAHIAEWLLRQLKVLAE